MIIRIKRFSYSPTETEGIMTLTDGGEAFATIEQPWVPNPNGAIGGKPNHSCVPEGMYRMMPHTSQSKGEVWIFWNEELGVFKFPRDHVKDHGRDVCYLHAANWAAQLEGCVAPGLGRQCMRRPGEPVPECAVTSSGAAMSRLHKLLGKGQHILSIESALGARE